MHPCYCLRKPRSYVREALTRSQTKLCWNFGTSNGNRSLSPRSPEGPGLTIILFRRSFSYYQLRLGCRPWTGQPCRRLVSGFSYEGTICKPKIENGHETSFLLFATRHANMHSPLFVALNSNTPRLDPPRGTPDSRSGGDGANTPDTDTESADEKVSTTPAVPYTMLTHRQRTLIAYLVGMATMFSPLAANIYLPCVPLLVSSYGTTLQAINLTITGYVIIQGVAPAVFSELAETLGRRPVYLIAFAVFISSSICLALQDNYPALLVFRMIQSLGSSVCSSMGYAVVADMAAPAERGSILAPTMMMMNLGPVVAPVIGGPMCYYAGWRWIFWFLAIIGSFFLLAIVLFLPETNRRIVGNGAIRATGWNRPCLSCLVAWAPEYDEPQPKTFATTWDMWKHYTPNPLNAVGLILQKDTFCVLMATSIFYMLYYVSQASLPGLYQETYGFDEAEIGLLYLALGAGMFCGSKLQGESKVHTIPPAFSFSRHTC